MITRKKWLVASDQYASVPIGVHVRLGDFNKSDTALPLSWHVDALKKVRELVGCYEQAIVVSDGAESELKELLQLPNVQIVRTGSAIGDLLLLAKSKVLIGSAGSTFTMWASFLGQMTTVVHPSAPIEPYKLINTEGHYLGPLDVESPRPEFIRDASASLALEIGRASCRERV